MLRVLPLTWLSLGLALAASPARAGLLLSATLERVGPRPITITANGATGSFDRNRFTLDAGTAFAGRGVLLSNRFGPVLVVDFRGNGALSGTLAQTHFAPLSSRNLTWLSITSAQSATGPRPFGFSAWSAFINRTRQGAILNTVTFLPPLNVGGGTSTLRFLAASTGKAISNDSWHLAAVARTGLTADGAAQPDVMATGGVAATPSGGTRITLVSLSRVHSYDAAGFRTQAQLHRLTLVYAPEPAASLLAAAAFAALGLARRRRARPRA